MLDIQKTCRKQKKWQNPILRGKITRNFPSQYLFPLHVSILPPMNSVLQKDLSLCKTISKRQDPPSRFFAANIQARGINTNIISPRQPWDRRLYTIRLASLCCFGIARLYLPSVICCPWRGRRRPLFWSRAPSFRFGVVGIGLSLTAWNISIWLWEERNWRGNEVRNLTSAANPSSWFIFFPAGPAG